MVLLTFIQPLKTMNSCQTAREAFTLNYAHEDYRSQKSAAQFTG